MCKHCVNSISPEKRKILDKQDRQFYRGGEIKPINLVSDVVSDMLGKLELWGDGDHVHEARDRIIENELLRKQIIRLRDMREGIPPEEVIGKLIYFTESLKA